MSVWEVVKLGEVLHEAVVRNLAGLGEALHSLAYLNEYVDILE